jgi:hypothetical protein
MRGTGQRADMLARRFEVACKRLNLNNERPRAFGIDTSQFRVPPTEPKPGDQLRLF